MMRRSISGGVNQGSTITTEQRRADSDRTVLRDPVMHLYVVLNCECIHDGASRYALDAVSTVNLGRGEKEAGIRADDGSVLSVCVADGRVSREHARLHLRDGAWIVQDLGSKNGTWVNGRKVDGSTPVVPGAIIEVGNTFLTLRPSVAPQLADAVAVRIGSKPRGLVTVIPELVDTFEALATFARSNDGQVSILGETGVGKEVLARAYHDLTRRPGAFNAVNCAAMPDGLVEAQLFGHRKGAYSGATTESQGFVRAADGGTLFLDEIGDLPLLAQAKLLRILEAREVTPVGASKPVPVDVRVVCATHRDLAKMVAEGTFRHDLWARLKGFVLELPALRARTEDIGLLVSAAVVERAPDKANNVRLSASAARSILMRRWPENIRELKRDIERALSYAKNDTIDVADLPPAQAPHLISSPKPLPATIDPDPPAAAELLENDPPPSGLDAYEVQLRAKIVGLLHEHQGNVSKVAQIMNKHRSHLHEVLRKLGIDAEKYRRRIRSFD
jgi:DNA-binding NtrC family response regulator